MWAANLGEYRLPSVRDLPHLRTVLVTDAHSVGTANVKSIGELTTPPVAAAVANAVATATGGGSGTSPITADPVHGALARS